MSILWWLLTDLLTTANWYVLFLEIDLFEAELLRVTTLLGNASVLDQNGLEHASPLASGGMFSNGGANVDRWASPFQSEVWILTINITSFRSDFICLKSFSDKGF